MDSIDADDVQRVERDYVDPNATREAEIQQALADAGIEGASNDAFSSLMVSAEDVEAAVEPGRDVTLRGDVETAIDSVDKPRSGTRDAAVVQDAARELGAPTESEYQSARRQIISNADIEAGGDQQSNTITLKSNPDLDPVGEREIGTVSDATKAVGEGGRFSEKIDRAGKTRGVYKLVDESGTEYPVAEVDL